MLIFLAPASFGTVFLLLFLFMLVNGDFAGGGSALGYVGGKIAKGLWFAATSPLGLFVLFCFFWIGFHRSLGY